METQKIVLREIFLNGKKITPIEIAENTGLGFLQVHRALQHLKNRGLIKKQRIYFGAKDRTPPKNKILVEVNEKATRRIQDLIK